MLVVLDANTLVADFRLQGTHFGLLLDTKKRLGMKLCVPEVVLEETVNKFRERVEDHLQAVARNVGELGKLVSLESKGLVGDLPDSDQVVKDYRLQLQELFKTHSIKVLPVPQVEHSDIIARDLLRKKPFGGRSGYRDYLIWESILQLLRLARDDLVYVTENKKDFAKEGEIHPDLIADLEARQLQSHRVSLSVGLRAFNERYVIPYLTRVEDLKEELDQRGVGPLDLHEWVSRNCEELLDREDLLVVGVGVPPGVGSAGPPRLRQAPEIQVQDVYEVEPGSYLARLEVILDVEFSIDFDWEDYESSEEVRAFLGPADEPFSSAFSDFDNEFKLELELRIEGRPPSATAYEIHKISARYLYLS